MNLAQLKKGQKAVISKVDFGRSSLRIMELGLVANVEVKLISVALTGDPLAFQVGDSIVSLRKSDAALVQIHLVNSV
jgi:Fe2+ transport system protein FeoA